MRNFKYGEAVHVSDDGKNWTPALLTNYRPNSFYRWGVQLPREKDTVYFAHLISVKEKEKWKELQTSLRLQSSNKYIEQLKEGFYQFLQGIPKGIRGTMDNRDLINKYLNIQRELVLQAYKEQYHD